MTMPSERTRAVIQTREFLQILVAAEEVPEHIKEEARRLLRHYPDNSNLRIVANVCPDWWGIPHSE